MNTMNAPLPNTARFYFKTKSQKVASSKCKVSAFQSQVALKNTLDELKLWSESKGAVWNKVDTVTRVEDGVPVLVATSDIASGETLGTIPDSLWITQEVVSRSGLGKFIQDQDIWVQLALFLINEKNKSTSDWKVYLPRLTEIESPLLWSDTELEAIQGTQTWQNLNAYRSFFASKFEALQRFVFSASPSVFPANVFTLQEFMWAATAVRSVLHEPLHEEKTALVPLADSICHGRDASVRWRVASTGLFGRGQALIVEATRSLRKGAVLSMDYGPGKPDNSILLDYGVMDMKNPQPGYSISLSVPSSDRFGDDKLDILSSEGVSNPTSFVLEPNSEPPEQMMAMLRLMQLGGGDAFLLESVFRATVWGHLLQPLSRENEEAVCRTMTSGAQAALTGYPTRLEDDLREQRSGQYAPGSRMDLALRVRLGEKQTLDSVIAFFEARLASLESLVYYQERRLRRLGLIDDDGRTTYDSFFKDGIA